MFEKVNPAHPDKLCDRIAGAIVDIAYEVERDPRIAVEVLLGHGICHIIAETDIALPLNQVEAAVERIAGKVAVDYVEVAQDIHLSKNQEHGFRCGDNGIFKGVPVTKEQRKLTKIAKDLYDEFGCDGKYILDGDRLIICQSNVHVDEVRCSYPGAEINPIGDWSGGSDVDTGAVNRKLGSDMADSVTGGGLHGKDLSKADVSVNIWAWLRAQEIGEPVEVCCAIGDDHIGDVPFSEIVETAREYIRGIDNSSGTSTIRNDCCCPRFNPVIKPGTKYTFLVEFRNNQTVGAGAGTDFYLVQQNGYVQFWGQNTANAPAAKLEGVGGASTLISALPTDGSYAFSRFTKFSEPEGSDHLGSENIMATFVFRANAGLVVDYDIRISLYLGEYWGPYVPYVVSDTSAIRKAVEDAQASADAAQDAIDSYISSMEIVVGTQTGATGSWTGVAGFSQLSDGQQIAYWLPYAGSGNASLNLTLAGGGTTGAIPVYYRGSTRATTHFAAGTVIHLTYRVNANVNGTNYTGWWADASYDSGNYYNRLRFEQAVLAKTAITASRLIVGDANGYFHVAAGVSFDITKPILWASSAIAAGATGTNNYLALQTLNLRNNLAGITMTQYETCYLVGTLSGKTFIVRTGNFFTSTVPTTDDGYYYIALGYLATTYQIYLYPEHPIYKFVNGQFMNLNQVAYEAQANVDALETTVTEAKAEIKQTTDAISLEVSKKVGNTEIISKINQSAETVSINASKINLNGAVTANNYFKIKTDGSMEATNGTFTGTVEGSEIIGSSIKFKNTSGRELIVLNDDGLVINGYINSAFRIVDDDNNNIVRFSQDGIDINGAYYLSTLGFDPGRLKLNTLGGVGDAFSTEPIQWIAADGTTYNAVMSDFMSGLKEVTQSLTPSLITLKILRAIDIERNSIFRNGSIFGYGSQIPVCFAGATTKHGINGLVMHLREAKVIWGTIPLEKPIDYSVANANITLHYDSITFYQNNKTLTKGTITCSCYRTFMGIQVVFNNSVSFAGTVHDAVVVEMTGCYLTFS